MSERKGLFNYRYSFSDSNDDKIPNLIEVQKSSYQQYLQRDTRREDRLNEGLEAVFRLVFPIKDPTGKAILEYEGYEIKDVKFDVDECRRYGLTYSAPVEIICNLIIFDKDINTGENRLLNTIKQDVYVGDLPLMTESGTFVVSGTERVVVNQIHRSPGVFFDNDLGTSSGLSKIIYSARIIPYRGSWIDFEFDNKDLLYVKIDRKRKIYVSTFLKALGLNDNEIIQNFHKTIVINSSSTGWEMPFDISDHLNEEFSQPIVDPNSGEILVEANRKITKRVHDKVKAAEIEALYLVDDDLVGQIVAEDIVDMTNGVVHADAGAMITEDLVEVIRELGVESLLLVDQGNSKIGLYIRDMLANYDSNYTQFEALSEIYRVMNPGEPPVFEVAKNWINSLFFDSNKYDLSSVGRVKLEMRFSGSKDECSYDEEEKTLKLDDIIRVIKYLLGLRDGFGNVDDIDNLGNRRVRSVGEMMENQISIGFSRMKKAILDKMAASEVESLTPKELINSKFISSVVKEFFGSSQLSQFMDQTNPLSDITHKRRISALGPGGLNRDRAGFEVRDVHPTHFGRICPIETPEGPNIGLINSLSTYAKINKYGFIQSAIRKVKHGKIVGEDIDYLDAMDEAKYKIAPADSNIDKDGSLVDELVTCRFGGEVILTKREEVDYIDASPKQLVSVAASLIPFLENDDANRALMGSNMQRQAVPLIKTEAPLVGTGMERIVARDTGTILISKSDGYVDRVDGNSIVIRLDNSDISHDSEVVDIYHLKKFQRSNQGTCINQMPLVQVGQRVKEGDILADGPSTDRGELALGKNILVAFMPWNGYNYEDSILLSERMVSDDVFTSIHIEEFEIEARDTKLGQEEITRDIPSVSDESLKNLDESGIIYIGAHVKHGDILVGKTTPKGEAPSTPEDKLLRAIFNEKASDSKDSSLRLSPGNFGTVVDVHIFNRQGVEKNERQKQIERKELFKLKSDYEKKVAIFSEHTHSFVRSILEGSVLSQPAGDLSKGAVLNKENLELVEKGELWKISVNDEKVMFKLEKVRKRFDNNLKTLEKALKDKTGKITKGHELPASVLKKIKVFIAVKRKIRAGDKMAGRHGNKGVVSKIVPAEDLPFLADGTPVDIVLNPLGVPSRMNVGQILETHLGWASANFGKQLSVMLDKYVESGKTEEMRQQVNEYVSSLHNDLDIESLDERSFIEFRERTRSGFNYATPVFNGAKLHDIEKLLEGSGVDPSGQVTLYDGLTGEAFDRLVTVGYIYMLKLHHLVDDKLHARSIGPYSLITQQPLGGKAQFGGQRLGEMEVWALEAYGAANVLQEMLTVKSDDIQGRERTYEAISRGIQKFEVGIPESFNVLIKELRSLALNIEPVNKEDI